MELRRIDWHNFKHVSALRPGPGQTAFLPSVDHFMAQAYVNRTLGHADVCRALVEGDTVVGFTKIVDVPAGVPPYHFDAHVCLIDGLLIDRDHQGKGHGSSALSAIIRFIEDDLGWRHDDVRLTCHEGNTAAIRFFERHGFAAPGERVPGRRHLLVFSWRGTATGKKNRADG